MIPMLQIACGSVPVADVDGTFDQEASEEAKALHLLDLIVATCSGDYVPRLFALGNCNFQITRGERGITL